MCYGEIISQHLLKARAPHQCAECRRPIEVGTEYIREVGKADAQEAPEALKYHKVCMALQRVAHEDSGETCYYVGDAWQSIGSLHDRLTIRELRLAVQERLVRLIEGIRKGQKV